MTSAVHLSHYFAPVTVVFPTMVHHWAEDDVLQQAISTRREKPAKTRNLSDGLMPPGPLASGE